MQQPFDSENYLTDTGYPAGGYANAVGVSVEWQDKPLREETPPGVPSGAFVETLLAMCIERLEFYQQYVPCRENELAIQQIDIALMVLNARTKRREAQGIEGTHEERHGDGTLADQIVPDHG